MSILSVSHELAKQAYPQIIFEDIKKIAISDYNSNYYLAINQFTIDNPTLGSFENEFKLYVNEIFRTHLVKAMQSVNSIEISFLYIYKAYFAKNIMLSPEQMYNKWQELANTFEIKYNEKEIEKARFYSLSERLKSIKI
jgi:hypothetical protein